MRRVSADEGLRICNALRAIPEQIREILAQSDAIREIAKQYVDHRNFLYLGRGFNYPVALEGALKLKEISYVHAEGYPAAEMKHGPIALIDADMPTVVVCPTDALFDKVISNMQEVKARGGRILAITDATDGHLDGIADHVIRVPKTLSPLTPLLHVVPLQLLAYHIAVLRGCDVDMPRNLAKSVTVE
jgi:glutamine---fructose-6-phosphate transaminase (isomerizing)